MIFELAQDFHGALEAMPSAHLKRRAVLLVGGALDLSAHVLVRDARQLAGQLHGRLLGFEDDHVRRLLARAADLAPRPCLLPITPSLTSPGGPLIRTIEGHICFVNAVAVTPDGARAVSASDDKTLKVWDLAKGEVLVSFAGDEMMNACAVSPDGWTIIAGDESGRMHFLRLVLPEEVSRSAADRPRLYLVHLPGHEGGAGPPREVHLPATPPPVRASRRGLGRGGPAVGRDR